MPTIQCQKNVRDKSVSIFDKIASYQGIMGILSGILGNKFFIYCYTPLGELMDMLVLINCMVNFILYCIMSRQFRITFRKIFGIQKSVICLRNTSSGNNQSPVENILTEKYFLVRTLTPRPLFYVSFSYEILLYTLSISYTLQRTIKHLNVFRFL